MCGGTSISGPFTNFDLNFFQNITTFKVWTKSATYFSHTHGHATQTAIVPINDMDIGFEAGVSLRYILTY